MCQAFEQALLDVGAPSATQNSNSPDVTLVVISLSENLIRLRIDQRAAAGQGEEVMHIVSDRTFGADMYLGIVANALRANSISF
ncbi:hypothetical protein [Palleronia sp. THAF1]|uniref:hypothetical protein n=1 Tax=Palleronia sp. THAF1 TaxID=2587842 RepID=UPI0012693763|nr:hypothetical protein [Palleronia sp. THAF1]